MNMRYYPFSHLDVVKDNAFIWNDYAKQESERVCIWVLGYRICLFLRFYNWILKLFGKSGIFWFPLYSLIA